MKENMFGLVLLLLSSCAFAQASCGGVHVGGGTCLPPGDPRLGGGAPSPRPPVVLWADRWGAIASDGNGAFGIVRNKMSKQEAEESAIDECLKRGGKGCTSEYTYNNQCVAVGSNDTTYQMARFPTEEQAKTVAIQECEKRSGEECVVFYSGCSMPVRIQ